MAYVSAGLFLVCAMLTLITAIVGWDGASAPPELLIALVGAVFTVDLTNNVDFAILASMTVACSTLSFAIVQFFRLDFARWVLGFIGALVTVYYVWAIIRLSIDGLIQLSAMVFVSFVLWAAATVLVLLPATGRAMRGYHRKLARYPQQYPPQPPQQMGYPH